MEDNLFNKARDLRIPSHAIWAMQRTSGVPTMDLRDPYGTHRHVLYRLLGRRTNIFEYPTPTPKGCQQYPQSDTKIGNEGQTIQMRIPSRRNRISGIHHWTRRSQDGSSQDTSHMGLDNTKENQGNPMLPRILQLLPKIYRRF